MGGPALALGWGMRPLVLSMFLGGFAIGCGGAAPRVSAPELSPQATRGTAGPSEQIGAAMGVSGLHGTLSPREVRRALRPHMDALTGCFVIQAASFESLGGQIRMAIRIDGDGGVRSVHAEDSTVGDREVERCVRRTLRSVRFPRTHGGGEALVRWALSVQPPETARQARTWSSERVARVVRRRGAQALERCNAGSAVQVTAYLSRRGRVIRAGAASTEGHDDEVLDCVVDRVRRWRMPRTRARGVTKVTFEIG